MSEVAKGRFSGGRGLLGAFFALLVVLLVGRGVVSFYVDLLWFDAEGQASVFWTRIFWESGARLLIGSLGAGATWLAIRPLGRSLTRLRIRRRYGDLVISEQLPAALIRWGMIGTALLVGLWFGASVPAGTGIRALLLFRSEATGTVDPFFERDLRFYLFTLPFLQGAVVLGMLLTFFIAAVSAAGLGATGSIQLGKGTLVFDRDARIHAAWLGGVFLFLLACRFYLAPYGLVIEGSSAVQGIFGYADHHARVPAFQILGFLSVITGAIVIWAGFQGRVLPAAAAVILLMLAIAGAGELWPSFVQRFQVEPNELARETPYIEAGIAHTRSGFGLDSVDRTRLEYRAPSAEDWGLALGRLERLPIWTEHTLLTTFRQIESRFQYYEFQSVAMDRYPAAGGFEPVAVAVREVNPLGIPDPNWQNLHLRELYVSGMGAVAGQLNRHTPDGRLPMFLTGIPPEFRPGPEVPDELDLRWPSVFVGSRPQLYAVINPGPEAFLDPEGAPGTPGVDFPRGIPMTSFPRTLALAWRFQDWNLLFASEIGDSSRFVFRRDALARVRALAPFLDLPEAPWPVITEGRIVWIVEGFTASSSYPLARAHMIAGGRAPNYLRNSVKGVVDAVTGEVSLYVVDGDDPIISSARRAFPGLFLPIEEMPEEVRAHLRYSTFQLEAQSQVMVRYHQTDPPVFHGQQDRWTLATELSSGASPVEYRPAYALLTLPGEEEESFVLSTLFVPQGRQNLAGLLSARWREDGASELRLWDLPVGDQFPGPRQVEALVEQDPEISQQFSLWRQGGSQVWTGHLHLVPVGESLLYMEPIFLAADQDAIPEIRRFVVSDGRRVVMDPTLAGAVAALAAGMQGVIREGDDDLPAERAQLVEGAPGAGQALELLEAAEAHLRAGDWEGFGRRLEELRALLRRQAGGG